MPSVWSYQPDMPDFRDPDGSVWTWDPATHTYTKGVEQQRPDPEHSFGGDADLFGLNQIEHDDKTKNPLMEGYMAAAWARPNEVKCPNCMETTQEHVCPQCGKDLTPEWNTKDDSRQFDFPVQTEHTDGMPDREVKPNHDMWDNSFPSMISHLRKIGIDVAAEPGQDTFQMLMNGPSKVEVGRWLVDRQGHLHYDHGFHSNHERIAMRDGLTWPGDIGATGSVYNDGSADVMRVMENYPINMEGVNTQLQQAFGPVQLEGPMSAHPQAEKGEMFEPFTIQGGQWLTTPQVTQPITGYAWVKERPNGVQYQPSMVFVTEALQPEDLPLHNNQAAALISATGGAFSHAAYLASTEGIPTIVGLGTEYNKIETGNYLKIDPTTKTITVLPAVSGASSSADRHQLWNSILQHQRGIESQMPNTFSHIDEELAWKAANAPTLDSCPECSAPMMEKNASVFCPDCGHTQPVLTMASKLAFLPLLLEGAGAMLGGELGGAAAEGMGMGQVGQLMGRALGRGVGYSAGRDMAGGGQQQPQNVEQNVNVEQAPAGPSDDSASQATIAATTFGEEEVGRGTKNDGQNTDPDQQSSSGDSQKEHGDSPEQLKDVTDGIGGPKSSDGTDAEKMDIQDPALQHKALKAFHMNFPLVVEFANSDESGMDNPILKGLHELLEQAFPGYLDGNDPDGGTPLEEHPEAVVEEEKSDDDKPKEEKKETEGSKELKESHYSLWHDGWEVEAVALGPDFMAPPGQPVDGVYNAAPQNALCPMCGQAHAPGTPCTQQQQQMNAPAAMPGALPPGVQPAGNQKPTMPGSAVTQKVVTKIGKWSVVEAGFGDALEQGLTGIPMGIANGVNHVLPMSRCPHCGGVTQIDQNGLAGNFNTCKQCGAQIPLQQEEQQPPHAVAKVALRDAFEDKPDEHTQHHHHDEGHSDSPDSQHHDEHDPSDLDDKGNNEWVDEAGAPLQVGATYELKSPNYAIPDRITVTNVLPEKLIFTIHSGDVDYQDEISKQDVLNEGYTFGPSSDEMVDSESGFPEQEQTQVPPPRPGMDGAPQTDDLSTPSTVVSSMEDYTGSFSGDDPDARGWLNEGSGGSVEVDATVLAQVMGQEQSQSHSAGTRAPQARYAGKDFSPREQRAFIEEAGTARNLDMLQLEGTHYVDEPEIDVAFNW